jgi:DNA-directed RNA polymerase subunit F
LPYKIIDYRDIPNPIAKKLLEEYLAKVKSYDISLEPARSALEYLQTLTTMCNPDKAEELMNILKNEFRLRDTSISLIINILPKTIDELRMLLAFETTIPEEDALHKILELVKVFCG